MNRNLGSALGTIILLLLVVGAVWFLFFREVEPLPAAPAVVERRPAIATPAAKPELNSPLVEKVEKYDTGEVRCRYTVDRERPAIKHGQYQELYRSGARKLDCKYADNLVEGPVTYWYEDGKEALRGTFKQGLRDGAFVEFHPGGNLKIEETYRAGELDGPCREFYDAPEKPVMIEKTFTNGKLSAPTIFYRPDGTIKDPVGLEGKSSDLNSKTN